MKKSKKPSRLDALASATALAHKDESSEDIGRRYVVLTCAANTADAEIQSLSARLTEARARRARLEAEMTGLARVVERR